MADIEISGILGRRLPFADLLGIEVLSAVASAVVARLGWAGRLLARVTQTQAVLTSGSG